MTRKTLLTLAILAMSAVLWGASITVTSPDGTPWCLNSAHTITWTSSGVTGTLTIALREIHLAPGAEPTLYIVTSTANDGSHPWTVPGPGLAPGDYFIRVRTDDQTVVGDSVPFHIYAAPTIQVTQPNGATWLLGTTHNIIWTKTCDMQNSITIALREIHLAPGAEPTLTIVTGTANDGSYPNWTVPNDGSLSTGDYFIRVRTDDMSVIGDSVNFHIGSGGGVEPECLSFFEKLRSIRHVDVRLPILTIPPQPNFCYCPRFYVSEISKLLAQAKRCFPPRTGLSFVLVKKMLPENDLVVAKIGTYGPTAVPDTLTATVSRTEFFAMRSHIENFKLGVTVKVKPPIGFPDQQPKDVMIKFSLKLLSNVFPQPVPIEAPK